jgi:hypothetical protein
MSVIYLALPATGCSVVNHHKMAGIAETCASQPNCYQWYIHTGVHAAREGICRDRPVVEACPLSCVLIKAPHVGLWPQLQKGRTWGHHQTPC